ncbi:MAG: error-prone DNA polymerase [Rhodoferax sp.]|uniref:error-prone DNA polymerase n=1 Tax=Rhodoferax sp. TaxID=50421 RepID=UPI0013FFA2DC|nr:error-prone DNA polymerase [Rhodoferax sp.]NDP38999.1 error-prone DNA polymerase [Rhodoferax sp.]
MSSRLPAYAELHCLSNFSFGRGASHPEELVARAAALGYTALALTDECSVAGVVRAHTEAKKLGFKLLPGAEFAVTRGDGAQPAAGFHLVALPHDLQAWGDLCEFITQARRAAPKGQYWLVWQDAPWGLLSGCEVLLALPYALFFEAAHAITTRARALFGTNLWLLTESLLTPDDALQGQRLQQLARLSGVPLVAAGNVHMHVRSRKPLQDVLSAVRLGQPVFDCGRALQPNAEAHLRSRQRLVAIYPPDVLANTLRVAQRCTFSLDELRYQYPLETVLPGLSAAQTLRRYTAEGALNRYPQGTPASVQQQLAHELALIEELKFEMYFLTVHDIVRFARSRHILCQGRGSAANSAVCYCLGVTEVDPSRMAMLFERFISRERDEPPDIDVDFEHQRREEVIQYIYAKYGRERAALSAVVISYRPRSALRDVGRALTIPEALITALAKEHPGMYSRTVLAERLQSAMARLGPDFAPPAPQQLQLWFELSTQLQRFPRHLSQHPGGFVLTRGKLTRLVPVENAAMAERSIIQWDKDDLDAMGLLKVDVLALGMLSAIRRCLDLISVQRGTLFRMQDIPIEDPATYAMICQADTVGVFQIESRAQMSMLPRLKPRCFYDLVVEVAIVRPGPIQGGMVHPYLKAREHPAQVQYASPALKEVLKRTLGVPIFQEQVMQIAMAAADFSAGEADSLRRSMAAWKRQGGVHKFYDRLVGGMLKNGYTSEFAEQIFSQIEGFGEYGFPESHAASFALLVYVSSWLKHHEPACFLAAMLNSQPMGFYGPSQLVQDAQRHGVEVRAVDVSHSDWDCTLEPAIGSVKSSKRLGSDYDFGNSNGKEATKLLGSDPNSGQKSSQNTRPSTDLGSDPNSGATKTPRSVIAQSPDVCRSLAVRLGLRQVSGLSESAAQRIVAARVEAPFTSTEDLALRCALDAGDLKALASADALASLSGHRRQQVWDAAALQPTPGLLRAVPVAEAALQLPPASEGEEVIFDYAALGLTLRSHPLLLLREQLSKMKLMTAAQLRDLPNGRLARACGIVTMRQQPQTAKGVVFVTLEDETGHVNVIVWKSLKERQRPALLRSRLLAVYGTWQRDVESGGDVCHLIAGHLQDLTPLLGGLTTQSREFC